MIIDERFDNQPLSEVLEVLKKEYDLKFAFSKRLIEDKTISVDIRKEKLPEAMQIMFAEVDIDYEIIGTNAVLLREKGKRIESEHYSITGLVKDAETGETMPFAHVYTSDLKLKSTTNEYGLFTLSGLQDSVELKVSFVGYPERSFKVGSAQSRERLLFELVSNAEVLEELVVTDEAREAVQIEGRNGISIDPKLVNSIPTTAERDPIRMAQVLPGVSATNELSVGMEIQGGNSTQNVVIFDGFTIYHLDHFFGYFSAINPYSIKHQRLLQSGYSTKFGGAASGVMQITGRDGNSETISGALSVNQMSFNSSLEIPISKSTNLFVSARRSYSDFLKTSLFDQVFDEYRQQLQDEGQYVTAVVQDNYEPDFHFNDFNFKLSTHIDPRTQASLSLYSSEDRLNFSEFVRLGFPEDSTININSLGFVNWGNIGSSVRLARYWNKKHFTELFLSYSHYGSEYEDFSIREYVKSGMLLGMQNVDDKQENFIEDVSLDIEHEWTLEDVFLETGLQATLYNTKISSILNDTAIVNKKQQDIALITQYAHITLNPGVNTNLGFGLRTNYLTGRDFFFEPRLSARQNITEELSLKASTGIHRQFVNQIITYNTLQGSRDLWAVADHEVPDQRAFHLSTGLTLRKKNTVLELGFFYKEFNGIMDYAFRQGARQTEYLNYEENFFSGAGFSHGVQAMHQISQDKFTGLASYTYQITNYQFDDINNGNWFPADHDQRHELNLLGTYQLRNFDFSIAWYYGSGLPYTEYFEPEVVEGPPGQGPEDNAAPNSIQVYLPDGPKNGSRFNAYHRLDLSAGFTKKIGALQTRVTANVFNVYDRSNFYDRQVDYDIPRPEDNPPPPPTTARVSQDDPPPPQGESPISYFSLALLDRTFSLGLEIKF